MKSERIPIGEIRFLIAEDHEFQRGMLRRMLAALGATSIREASDGHTALRILEDPHEPVDIVISDLEMPGMDGMEFIRRLGESKASVAIILASALESKLLDSVAIMTAAYGLHLLGIVEKPLSREKVGALIAHYRRAGAPRAATVSRAATAFTVEEIAAGVSNNEFEAFLQPKVDLESGCVKGAEALARWRHPQKGIIAPAQFIKPLEESGRIDELTFFMLRKAAAACSAWRSAGLDATVSVNLSLTSLVDAQLAGRVLEVVRAEGLEPRHMVLEVTESATSTNLAKALENLTRLRMNGFGLSIDDYGTGYSSMQQLARIPFTELKIDQSFVTNASGREPARIMLESSLELARKLVIAAVAEGVESEEDLSLLCELGCDLAQGYLIARPMQAEAFPDWCAQRGFQEAARHGTSDAVGEKPSA